MTALSPRLRELALSPSDQIMLAAMNGVRWAPPEPPIIPPGSKFSTYGKVKRIAEAFVAGDYGGKDYTDVAIEEKVATESLKQALWRIRSGHKQKSRRRVAA